MSAPACSIVVPTRNRRASLERALAALLCQQPAGVAELIVVDDGSTDDTPRLLDALGAEGRLAPLRMEGVGPAAARNAGLRAARAPAIACTDDDCEVPHDWAARLVARLETTGAAVVGGRVTVVAAAPRPARVSQAITNGLVRALNRDPGAAVFLTSNNVAYRAQTVRAAGGFDEAFSGAGAEERELHHRLRTAGQRLVYADDIVVIHRPSLTWPGFLEQHAGYGRGARLFYGEARGRGGVPPRHFGPLAYARAFAAAFGEVGVLDWPALAVGVAASQAAVLAGYLAGPRR